MPHPALRALVEQWRAEADRLNEQHGLRPIRPITARVYVRCADQLAAVLQSLDPPEPEQEQA